MILIDATAMRRVIERYADLIEENADLLTELDSAIGDADHGANMRRGLTAARERLAAAAPPTPEAVLKAVASAFISKTGGASGPLYGTAFLRAASAVAGKETLEKDDVAGLFHAALDGLRQRGQAQLGDKTMIDAFAPAVEALEAALAAGAALPDALEAARAGAYAGSDATVELVARKGRASYLGARSAGHRDPGSWSTALLFDAAASSLR